MNVLAFPHDSAKAAQARAILESKIERGKAEGALIMEKIHAQAPADMLVPTRKFDFSTHPDDGRFVMQAGALTLGIHRHALGQIAEKAGVPGAYLNELANAPMVEGGALDLLAWKRDLAATILNRSFSNLPAERALVRAVGNQVRGVLSDRYRRLDSRPLLDTFASECQAVGAVPVEGIASDVRVSMKAIIPRVLEPVPGEHMVLGAEWGNSDFGAGKHSVRCFVLRLWCLNGATMEDALSQVHLGGRLSDDIEFSTRTMDLDTQASMSALRDVVRGVLSEKKVDAMMAGIRAANEKKVDWKRMRTALQKRLFAGELKAVEEAYKSDDVVMLPAGESAWRASNAVSWIAQKVEDPDRRLEMQRLAGELVNGKADKAA
jgi:hypothetical protein